MSDSWDDEPVSFYSVWIQSAADQSWFLLTHTHTHTVSEYVGQVFLNVYVPPSVSQSEAA